MIAIPEHDKLKKVADKSQACGSFIDWLRMKGFYIKHEKRSRVFNLKKELAEYFRIDEEKLEMEKRAMLEEIRKGNT